VVEPLRKLRVIVEPERPSDSQLGMDVTWTSPIDPFEEPRQYLRTRGTLVFNTQRFAQLGRWEGTLAVDGTDIAVDPRPLRRGPGPVWGVRPRGREAARRHPPDHFGAGRHVELHARRLRRPLGHLPVPRGARREPDHADRHAGVDRPRPAPRLPRAARVGPRHHQRHPPAVRVATSRSPRPPADPSPSMSSRWPPTSSPSGRATASSPTGATACGRARNWSSRPGPTR